MTHFHNCEISVYVVIFFKMITSFNKDLGLLRGSFEIDPLPHILNKTRVDTERSGRAREAACPLSVPLHLVKLQPRSPAWVTEELVPRGWWC